MIAIVDIGGANHASVLNALRRLDAPAEVTANLDRLTAATHLILPGVGHAAHAMMRLRETGLAQWLCQQTKPTLGICLGMQILFTDSEEGPCEGLGLLRGSVRKLEARPDFRVPHMGWTPLTVSGPSRLLAGIDPEASFYFVHSYAVPESLATKARARGTTVPAVLEFDNFYATQFHPERSGQAGARVLRNFLALEELKS